MRSTSVKKMHSNKAPKVGKPKEQSSPHPKPKVKKVDADDFEQEAATEDQLSKIKKMASQAVSLEHQIEDLQAAIVTLANDRDTILQKTLPAALDSAGMKDFTLDDGSYVEIKDFINGSLPSAEKKPEERKKALAWLMKNGGKGLIKTSFLSEFGVGQEKLVDLFEKVIIKNKFTAKKQTGVHPQTLYAFVRELLEDGKQVPVEMLGLYAGRVAKIKLPEAARAKADAERINPKRKK